MPDHSAESTSAGAWLRYAWVFLAAAGLSLQLGDHALIDPDEGRIAAIAGEMASSGDFLIPTLDGLPCLDKPFLFFSTAAASIRLLGPTETATRLPSLIFAWATIVLTAWFAARLFGPETAWVAGVAAATAPLSIVFSKTARFDTMLTFFLTLALVSFYLALESRLQSNGASYRYWTLLAWLSMALGVLTKGPVALAVPLLIAAPYAAWRKASLAVWHPAGWLMHLAVVIPWVWFVESRLPGFLRYALVTETWHRVTTDQLNRTGPIWYFLPYLLGGAFPWLVVAFAGCRRRWPEIRKHGLKSPVVYLILWVVLPLVFFSLSQSKRPQYILPVMPAIALLAAWSWGTHPQRRPLPGARATALCWLVLAAALLVTIPLIPNHPEMRPELIDGALSTARLLAALALAAGLTVWLAACRRSGAIVALSLPLVVLPSLVAPLLSEAAALRSGKDLAAALTPSLTAETLVVGLEAFSPSLTFYLGRPVMVASTTGEPLDSNYILHSYEQWVDTDASSLRSHEWWWQTMARCRRPSVFILHPALGDIRRVLEERGMPLLFEDRRWVAYGPCQQGR